MNKLTRWIAWHLPRQLVMWCGIRMWAYATQGKYGHEDATTVLASDIVRRWENEQTNTT